MSAFDFDRFGFVVMGKNIVVMRRKDREMQTMEWARRKLGISDDDLDYITRGYITRDRIQFFTADYATDDSVDADLVMAARLAYKRIYLNDDAADVLSVPVFNGVRKGKRGENWPPYLVWDNSLSTWEIVEEDEDA